MNYLVNISYDGSNYHGWAKQQNNITIQNVIENILESIYKKEIKIIGSGRTDSGVHAINQYFNFKEDVIKLTPEQLSSIIINRLPSDIVLKKIKIVNDNFSARFNAKNKTYVYVVNAGNYLLYKDKYLWNYNKHINLQLIKQTANLFVGVHDFLSFSKSKLSNTLRKINFIKIAKHGNIIKFFINGNGFLRNMVRMIIATLIALNEKKITIEDIKNLLVHPKKGKCIFIAPPNGLYLYKVTY